MAKIASLEMRNPLAIPAFLDLSTRKSPTRFHEDPLFLGSITAYIVGTSDHVIAPAPPASSKDTDQPASVPQGQLTQEPSIPVAVQSGLPNNPGEVGSGSEETNFQNRFSPIEPLLGRPIERPVPAEGQIAQIQGPQQSSPPELKPALSGLGDPAENREIAGSHAIVVETKLREAPSANSVASIVLKLGTPVQVITVTKGWVRVKYESNGILQEGYVRARELKKIR